MTRTLHPHPGAIRAVTCKNGKIHATQGFPCFTLSGVEAHAIRLRLDSGTATCGPHVILLYGAPTMYYDEKTGYSVFEETQEGTHMTLDEENIKSPMSGKELRELAKKKGIQFVAGFVKAKGSQIPALEVAPFEQLRPVLEAIYSTGYREAYLNVVRGTL